MFDLRINESGAVGVAGVKLIFAEAPDMDVVGFICNSEPRFLYICCTVNLPH